VRLTGEEIRARLTVFAARWSVYEGSERSEAQTFINELFECYGTRRTDVARFEEPQAGRFLDLIWPRVCLIEMKAPREARRLQRHRLQALQYWTEAGDASTNIPSPKYVVLCAFRKLEIWEPGAFPTQPRIMLELIDLPDQYDALLFLAGEEPVFAGGQAALTREAVVHIVDLYDQLKTRRAAGPDVLRDFLLQCVWCLFAEDLGQIPAHRFTRVVDELIRTPHRSSGDDLAQLFAWLNTPGERPSEGLFAGTPYANGRLFEQPARVHLVREELEHLRAAAQFQWREVQPSIFGSLLEGGLGHDQQWRLGGHYTHEAYIQKVVQPTIVEPWRERIENVSSHREALAAQNDLLNYVVLDPACGSGNFLYVAYRELRRIEKRLHEREIELRKREGLRDQGSLKLHFPLQNIRGIEIEGFAVALARVTLWMGHKLAVDELELDESTLPLGDLSGIRIGDALRTEWERADAVIGNPPFHGSQHLRRVLGDPYVEWLKSAYGIGVKDYCVYWFRKAQDHLEPGKRAGLVGTNSISQNKARSESLDYIVSNGGVITSAVSTQVWPGEAKVHVSIVNWINEPRRPIGDFFLDGVKVSGITSALREGEKRPDPARLEANFDIAFQGPIPAGAGFIISEEEAYALLADADVDYRDVVKRYLMGDDIANSPRSQPTRWIIDFGVMPLELAEQWPRAMAIVRERVRPLRLENRDAGFRQRWWLFGRPRPEMRAALRGMDRFIVANRVGKRLLFTWARSDWCLGDKVVAFKLDDYFSLGVLSASSHGAWAWLLSSTLKADLNYTPTSAFETFPWPYPVNDGDRHAVAEIARRLDERRQGICGANSIGLTELYNAVGDGAWHELADLHAELDKAVNRCYGWPETAERTESLDALLSLNRDIAAADRAYEPFPR
jgi:hypothetical protein